MNLVKFPGLGIELNIPEIAFKCFGIDIYFYAIFIVLGICVALILAKFSKEKFGIEHDVIIENLVGAIICGYIGARLYYVIFNLDKYMHEQLRIFNIRDGGLAIYGGIIFGILFIFIKCQKKKIDFLNLCDYIAPFFAIAQSIGRWGNFFNKEAYGYETTSVLRMGLFNNYGQYVEVHPTFFYESISTFLIYLFLRKLQKNRKFKGEIFYSYIVCYSFIRIFIEGLRADSLMLGPFKISQILSVIFFVVFYYLLLKNNKKH